MSSWNLYKESNQSQVDELKEEISEYERLLNCDRRQPMKIKVESLTRLPDVLVKARIAARMSQKELAQMLGIDEERVKNYEDSDYQCASFVELLEVSTALGIEFEVAVVRVDFEEIEMSKKTAEKWRQKTMNIAT
jgi:ribosome-binding protein aMBF1 (putative translation factor)